MCRSHAEGGRRCPGSGGHGRAGSGKDAGSGGDTAGREPDGPGDPPPVVNIAADSATVGIQSGVNIALDNATVGEQRGVILGDVHIGGGTPRSVADRIAAARAAAERARTRARDAEHQAGAGGEDGAANVASGDQVAGIQAGRIYGNVNIYRNRREEDES